MTYTFKRLTGDSAMYQDFGDGGAYDDRDYVDSIDAEPIFGNYTRFASYAIVVQTSPNTAMHWEFSSRRVRR